MELMESAGSAVAKQTAAADVGENGKSPEEQAEILCGLGSWRPAWLQWLANHYAYSVAFVLMGIIQAMSYTYFTGVVTTLERAFHVDSRTMGYIMIGNDISVMTCGFVLSHLANRGNRPFWMATGILIVASSCFIYASTQFFWEDSTFVSSLSTSAEVTSESGGRRVQQLCSSVAIASNATDIRCNESGERGFNLSAAFWLFIGQFVQGIGGTAAYTAGFSYMDDSIQRKDSSIYIGLTSSLRSLGPIFGYILASFCLKFYIKPYDSPEYDSHDPQWLGAWWLGFLIIGTLLGAFALPMLLFPKQLPSRKEMIELSSRSCVATTQPPDDDQSDDDDDSIASTWKDLLPSLKRLATNPVIVISNLSTGFYLIPIVGIYTFKPKYLEARFRQTASQASVLAGLSGTVMSIFGTFFGGLVIWKLKPGPMLIAGWIALVDVANLAALIVVMNLDCNDVTFEGVRFVDGRTDVTSECSQLCNCELNFDPICVGNQNFVSPCLAGCSAEAFEVDAMLSNVTKTIFQNCSCTSAAGSSSGRSGLCEDALGVCPNLWTYLIVFSMLDLISTTSPVGFILLVVRSVAEKDKGISLALLSMTGSLMGYIPGLLIYGAAVDNTCLLWTETGCGDKGNCSLYDVDAFNYWFHGVGIFCGFIMLLLDCLLVKYSRHINLYDDVDDRLAADRTTVDKPETSIMEEVMFTSRVARRSSSVNVWHREGSHKASVNALRRDGSRKASTNSRRRDGSLKASKISTISA